MRTRVLGAEGPIVSEVGFGAWQIGGHGWTGTDQATSLSAVARALEIGVTLFDTADVYGRGLSEEILAAGLGSSRHDVVVATKYGVRIGPNGSTYKDASRKYMWSAVEDSLRRLRLDCIPLYLVHWPDGHTSLDEILDGLEDARARGRIRSFGLSNFPVESIQAAAGRPGLVAVQCRFNLLDAALMSETVLAAASSGLGVIAHSTLAQGLLGGRVFPPNGFPAEDVRNRSAYFRPEALQDNLRTAGRVAAVARRLGRTPAQVAIRWAVDAPGITSALVGCKSPVQVDENCSVDFALTADDWASLDPSTDATLSNPRHL